MLRRRVAKLESRTAAAPSAADLVARHRWAELLASVHGQPVDAEALGTQLAGTAWGAVTWVDVAWGDEDFTRGLR